MALRRPRSEERQRFHDPLQRIEMAELDLDQHDREIANVTAATQRKIDDLSGKFDRLQWTLVGFTLTMAILALSFVLSGIADKF